MIGIDLVEIARIKSIFQKHGLLFLKKILTSAEINSLPQKQNRHFFTRLTCYIASKEAIFKAYAQEGLDWQDIVIYNITNRPLVYIKKTPAQEKIQLTFAANKDVVLAHAVIV